MLLLFSLRSKCMSIEKIATRRRGRRPIPAAQKRLRVISVWLNGDELALARGRASTLKVTPSEFFRLASNRAVPRSVPEINRQAWHQLARAASNLNQIALAMNLLGDALTLEECTDLSKHLASFRTSLVRADDRETDEALE